MILVIALHAVLGAVLLAVGGRIGRRSMWLALLGPLAIVAWVAKEAAPILAGDPVVETLAWVPAFDLGLDLRIDGFSLLFLAVIGVAGSTIFGFAARYMPDRPQTGRFAAFMALFGGAMAGIVSADNLFGLFVFWEVTTITSYLLIGHDDRSPAARTAALQAALVTATGGLAMLAGFVLLALASGTSSLSAVLADLPPGVDVALVLVLLGALTKSAQFPFHFWLPGAMAAPTPASAFLHSATMVKAGIYLIGRFSPAVLDVAWWRPAVVGAGLVTMLVGGWSALRQHDLKLLLAYGTVSQLGFIVALFGFGEPHLAFAGAALVVTHGLFKASLFMVVGAVDHEAGGRDLRKVSGLRRTMPRTFVVAAVASASMAAIPPTLGFVSKEAAFDGLLKVSAAAALVAAAASVFTVAYTARFLLAPFTGPLSPEAGAAHEARGGLVGWPALLAGASLAFGLFPQPVARLATAATEALTGEAAGQLVLWPGPTAALALSALVLASGAALAWGRTGFERFQSRLASRTPLPAADTVYHRAVEGMLALARRTTAVVQNGSLPVYLTVIVLTAVSVPTVLALRAGNVSLVERTNASAPEWALVAIIALVVAALLRIRRRFVAVMLLGAVGYSVAGLFLLEGGPDLALTQLLVETLVVFFFAFVLVRLPIGYDEAPRPGYATTIRVVTAVAVAVFVAVAVLVSGSTRTEPPVSDFYLEQALPAAGGANVVNVILVDFRGFDTLGEITVLVVATLGAAALVLPLFARRRGGEN
ncbi:MAG: hydrogen gas-evolving membrane-bound hydrogenase subunit E [Acidimicrobiia bacterium]